MKRKTLFIKSVLTFPFFFLFWIMQSRTRSKVWWESRSGPVGRDGGWEGCQSWVRCQQWQRDTDLIKSIFCGQWKAAFSLSEKEVTKMKGGKNLDEQRRIRMKLETLVWSQGFQHRVDINTCKSGYTHSHKHTHMYFPALSTKRTWGSDIPPGGSPLGAQNWFS